MWLRFNFLLSCAQLDLFTLLTDNILSHKSPKGKALPPQVMASIFRLHWRGHTVCQMRAECVLCYYCSDKPRQSDMSLTIQDGDAIQASQNTSNLPWDSWLQRNSHIEPCVCVCVMENKYYGVEVNARERIWSVVINFLACALRDPCGGEFDSKQRRVAGIKRLRRPCRPLLPLHGATHVCEEWKGSKNRTRRMLKSWLFLRWEGVCSLRKRLPTCACVSFGKQKERID